MYSLLLLSDYPVEHVWSNCDPVAGEIQVGPLAKGVIHAVTLQEKHILYLHVAGHCNPAGETILYLHVVTATLPQQTQHMETML